MATSTNSLSQLPGQIQDVMQLRKADEVAKLIPATAQFVTISTGVTIPDPDAFKNMVFTGYSTPLGAVHERGVGNELHTGYLWHDGRALTFITQDETIFSVPLNQILGVDRVGRENNILLLFRLPTGNYALGQPVQVETNPNMPYRTFDHASDATGGWYTELQRLGVIKADQVQHDRKQSILAFIFWAILFIGGIVVVIVLHSKHH